MTEFTNFIEERDPQLYDELFGLFRRSEPQPQPEPQLPKPIDQKPRFAVTGNMKTHAEVFAREIEKQLPIAAKQHLRRAGKSREFRDMMKSWWGSAQGLIEHLPLERMVSQALSQTINMTLSPTRRESRP